MEKILWQSETLSVTFKSNISIYDKEDCNNELILISSLSHLKSLSPQTSSASHTNNAAIYSPPALLSQSQSPLFMGSCAPNHIYPPERGRRTKLQTYLGWDTLYCGDYRLLQPAMHAVLTFCSFKPTLTLPLFLLSVYRSPDSVCREDNGQPFVLIRLRLSRHPPISDDVFRWW